MSGAVINLVGIQTLEINGATDVETSDGVTSFTVVGVAPSLLLNVNKQVGDYEPTSEDQVILFINTVTCILNSDLGAGTTFDIKNIGDGVVTVVPSSGTLDTYSGVGLNSLDCITVVFDGIDWWII